MLGRFMDLEKIIYEEANKVVTKNNIVEYIGKEGIWILYGQECKNADYVCLNVGKHENVGKEIIYDLGCLHYIDFRCDGSEEYVNQFGKRCGFKYKQGQVQEYLYPYIAQKYYSLKFVYVHDKSDSEIESEYAKNSEAFFGEMVLLLV